MNVARVRPKWSSAFIYSNPQFNYIHFALELYWPPVLLNPTTVNHNTDNLQCALLSSNPQFYQISTLFSELFCPVLETPYHGMVSPATCSKKYENIAVGSSCKFDCSKGYELKTNVGATTLSCRIDGTWNHGSPNCYRKSPLTLCVILLDKA